MKRIIYIFLSAFFLISYGFAGKKTNSSNVISITDTTYLLEIKDSILILIDAKVILSPADALANYKAGKFSKNSLDLSETKSWPVVIWCAVEVVNDHPDDIVMILQLGSYEHITLFRGNGPTMETVSTLLPTDPLSTREIKTGNAPALSYTVKGNSANLLFLKLIVPEKYRRDEQIRLYISASDQFFKQEVSGRFFQGIFLGIIIIMAVYNLFIFLSVRDSSYIYYVLTLLGSGLIWMNNMGYINEYFTPFRPGLIHGIDTSMFFAIFLILFARSFLATKKHTPGWHKFLNINLMIAGIIWVARFALPGLIDQTTTVSFLWGIFLLIFLFIITVVVLRRGYRPARYFFWANILFIAGTIIFIISNITGLIEQVPFLLYTMEIGQVGEMALFSFALADKINVLKQENEQKQFEIIRQLRENEALKDKVNRELEQKVKERTREIEQQKEEIQAQRDEIEQQRDVVTMQKDQIEEIHQELKDSILYAEHIQSALLSEEFISKKVSLDYFILFKPKDIVSGDFYWIDKIGNDIVVIAADCTGHGVPGAFMSMLGISFINEIIHRERVFDPGTILRRLREETIQALKQDAENSDSRDGMDVAISIINTGNLEMRYAGANNPMYFISEGDIQILKADKMPVGYYYRMDDFVTHHAQMKKGDCIYLFSDGFADQFGGETGRKFSYKRLREILVHHHQSSMTDQKKILATVLDEWMGHTPQTDDIMIVGIKL
ncbi:MAG: 7TM diverse intracellular signaling domain-containing protein [Bacteroidota bacterium]